MLELEGTIMVVCFSLLLLLRQMLKIRTGSLIKGVCTAPSQSRPSIFWSYWREKFKFESSQKLFEASGKEDGFIKRVWSHK